MSTASRSYSISRTNYSGLMWPANLMSFDYLQLDIKEFVKSSDVIAQSNTGLAGPAESNSNTGPGFFFTDIQTRGAGNTLRTILLPIPDNLQYTDNPSWSDTDVGVLGKTLPSMAKGLLSGDAGGATDAIQQAAGAGKIGAILEALGPLKNVTTQGLKGKIANPYKEQVFEGIGMRQFDFSWKLVPRSKSEQVKIQDIIKTIRENALPSFSAGDAGQRVDLASDRWLTVPKTFTLTFKYDGINIDSLPKIKPCICKNVQVSYTPDNVWATHMLNENDPAPVAYNLTLSFGETEIITGDDVNKGY